MSQEICAEMKKAIETELPDAEVQVTGGGGHFEISVVSQAFEGKNVVQKQRLVYRAIKHLMAGDDAPVHAVDRLSCSLP